MNAAVVNVLNQVLGEWIENLNKEDFKLSLFSGQVMLNNLKVKASAIDRLGLPYYLKCGFVGKIFVEIPWTSITSCPLKLKVENVFILLTPRDWTHNVEEEKDIQRRILERTKISELDTFEVLNDENLAQSANEPGYIEKLVTKIVDNIQVEIGNVYIRIEDNVSYRSKYAVGIVMRELKAITTNQKGEEEFVVDSKLAFKSVMLKGFSVYLDYHKSYPRKTQGDTIDDVVKNFVRNVTIELNLPEKEVKHQYLLLPTELLLKVILNKDNTNLDIPQARALLKDLRIGMNTDMEQLSRMTKSIEFFSFFSKFKTGLLASMPQYPMDEVSRDSYMELYRCWLLCKDSKNNDDQEKAEKYRKRMEFLELPHSLEDIKKIRTKVKKNLKLEKKVEEKKKEIEEIIYQYSQGKIEGFKNFFGYGKSQEEKERLEREKTIKIEELERSILEIQSQKEKLSDDMNDLVKGVASFKDVGDDYVKFEVGIYMTSFTLNMTYASSPLTRCEVNDMVVKAYQRPTSIEAELRVGETSIIDQVVNSEAFPKLLCASYFRLNVNTYKKTKIVVDSGDFYMVANMPCISKFILSLQKGLLQDIDVGFYQQRAMEKAGEVYSKSQDYIASTIQQGTQSSVDLNLSIKAPVFYIPYDVENLSDSMFVIDTGFIQASSGEEVISGTTYELYNFELTNFQLVTVWNCHRFDDWKDGQYESLLNPVRMGLKIYSAKGKPADQPSIMIDCTMDDVIFDIVDREVRFLISLGEKYMENAQAFTANIGKVDARSPMKQLEIEGDENLNTSFENEESHQSVQTPIPVSEPVASSFSFFLKSIEVVVKHKEIQIMKMSVENFSNSVHIAKTKEITIELKLEKVYVEDSREDIEFQRIVSNPLQFISLRDEDELIDMDESTHLTTKPSYQAPSDDTIYQVKTGIRIVPDRNLYEVSCLISNIRFVAFPEFLTSMQNFMASLKAPTASTPKNALLSGLMARSETFRKTQMILTPVEERRFIHATISLNEFELWIPMDAKKKTSKVANLSFCPVITYNSIQESMNYKNVSGTIVKSEPMYVDDEATLEIRHLNILVGLVKDNQVKPTSEQFSDFLSPCRISLDYVAQLDLRERVVKRAVNLNLESIGLVVGFRDLAFFMAVANSWQTSSTPQQATDTPKYQANAVAVEESDVKYSLDFTMMSDALQLTIVEDTGLFPISLVHSQFSNLSFNLQLEDGFALDNGFSMYYTSVFIIDCYNLKLSCWEPLIEDWTFNIAARKDPLIKDLSPDIDINLNPVLRLNIESPEILNINVSHSMALTLSTLLEKLKMEKESWTKDSIIEGRKAEVSKAHGVSYFTVVNNLKLPIVAQIDEEGSEKYHLKSRMSKDFTQGDIEKLRMKKGKSNKKLGLMGGIQKPACIRVTVKGFEESLPLKIEDGETKSFKVMRDGVKYEFMMDITGHGNQRILSIETPIKIMNNTKTNVNIYGIYRDTGKYFKESFVVNRMRSVAVPEEFIFGNIAPAIIDSTGSYIDISESKTIKLGDNNFITIQILKFETGSKLYQTFIQILNPVIFQNCLPCPVKICTENETLPSITLNPGETLSSSSIKRINSEVFKFSIFPLLPSDHFALSTNYFSIDSEKVHVEISQDRFSPAPYHATSVTIEVSKMTFTKNKDTDLTHRIAHVEKETIDDTEVGGVMRTNDSKLVRIYFEYFLVNKTFYNLVVDKNHRLPLPAQSVSFFHLHDPKNKVEISHEQSAHMWTDGFNINLAGVAGSLLFHQIGEVVEKDCMIGVKIEDAPSPMIYSKIVTFVPRYVVNNLLNIPLVINQFEPSGTEAEDSYLLIEKGQSKHFDIKNPLFNQILIQIGVNKNLLSLPFGIDGTNDFQIMIPCNREELEKKKQRGKQGILGFIKQDFLKTSWYDPSEKNQFMHVIRVVISTVDQATYYINFMNPRYPEFRIKNKTSLRLECWQLYCTRFTVEPGETLPFAFENHCIGSKKIIVKVGDVERECSIEKVQSMKKIGEFGMTVDLKEYSRRLIIESRDHSRSRVSKKLKAFGEKMRDKLKKQDRDSMSFSRSNSVATTRHESVIQEMGEMDQKHFKPENEMEISFHMAGFGLSIINDVPREILYFSISDIYLIYKAADLVADKQMMNIWSLLMSIKHIQLDNMDIAKGQFPVILNTISKGIDEPFLQISLGQKIQKQKGAVKKTQASSIIVLDWFIITVGELDIHLNQEALNTIFAVQNKFLDTFTPKLDTKETQNEFAGILALCPGLDTTDFKSNLNPNQLSKKVYINTFSIEPLKIKITFRTNKSNSSLDISNLTGFFGLTNVFATIASAFFDITDFPLKLSSVELQHAFETIPDLVNIVLKDYIRQTMLQLYKIIGTSEIIGNPIALIDKISTGVVDLVEEPVRMTYGYRPDGARYVDPFGFFVGVQNGMRSLVTNVISGGFESVSKMTGSLYNLSRQLSAMGENTVQINQSSNIFLGLFEGVYGTIEELYFGLSGIVIKPIKEAKRGGAKGFLKGVGSGLIGAVGAPISAALRTSTTLTSSVANTVNLLEVDKGTVKGRMRFPRQFGALGILEPYDPKIAQIQDLLRNLEEHKNESMEFYLHIEDYENVIVIITAIHVLLIVGSEVAEKMKVKRITNCEMHAIQDEAKNSKYVLIITGGSREMMLESYQFSALIKIYSAIRSLALTYEDRRLKSTRTII